ncbi:serine hydrolase [Ferruginibacter paludis]|uniref:serine hydrolase n=1 Tax=Ferruginibacter paludis TaxID=1310417 RepID=UPI0025B41825|nr:serine hydrolase [Ferruginibacter paludis]MDN3656278.1 serine hydrolase [Ferruginibacter paludis]
MLLKVRNLLSAGFIVFLLCCCHLSAQVPKPVGLLHPDSLKSTVFAPLTDSSKTDSVLVQLLKQYPEYFDTVLKNTKRWNVQFIYTRIDKGANGIPALKNYYFNVNPANYFYPASTVKLPVCLLALQRLNELKQQGIDKNSTMITEAKGDGQTRVYNDPSTPDGKPSIAQYIKKILLVSDNDAFNRLYEFLGRKYINEQLHQKGYTDIQILHRLDIQLTAQQNRSTNPVNFFGPDNRIIFSQPAQYDSSISVKRTDSLGSGYLKDGALINSSMDFSDKNRISLQDLHNILLSVVFPEKVPASQRFNITADDRIFLLKYMSELPTESQYPPYAADTVTYWPAYCKFLLFGSEAGAIPKNIRIFNKVGDAYGQLTDVAYIVDFDKKIEFFLSATMYCNSDGILNDDKYDYENTGFPFMKHLGEVIYQLELNRQKKIEPDLSKLMFNYDGH